MFGWHTRRVDGNDLVALMAVLGRAVELARTGAGPLLVEAHTYRMQAHTNADDATRYRQDAEVQAWQAKDPLNRMTAYLQGKGLLDAARSGAVRIGAVAGTTDVKAGSGDVTIGEVSADVGVRTGTGAVAVADARAGRMDLTTGSGGLTIGVHAGVLADHVPTAMLFVRNPSGISHSPAEHVEDDDAEAGAAALADGLAALLEG